MSWLALDIGGAKIKASDGCGYAVSQPFAMWKNSELLARDLRTLIAESPKSDHLAITMTGELADCFANRSEGVLFILDAVSQAADGRHVRVYLNDGKLVAPGVAKSRPLDAASSNWHALARFAGRFARQGVSLLIDIGSTSCDLIPLVDGQVAAAGKNDLERLLNGELVYTGVERSPLCAIVASVTYRGDRCPVAQELFATSRDAYLILGCLAEDEHDRNTADGQPATKAAARLRLSRMICATEDQFNHRDAAVIAQFVTETQQHKLVTAIEQVKARLPDVIQTVVLSGQGEFLARQVAQTALMPSRLVSLNAELGSAASRCAPAHALATLAREATES